MEKLKKIVLYISGPGVLLFELIVLFIHLFTPNNTKAFMVAGLFVFFVVFIPLYAYEYFRQEFSKKEKGKLQFKKDKKRKEWRGGNIHGKVPSDTQTPGKLFK